MLTLGSEVEAEEGSVEVVVVGSVEVVADALVPPTAVGATAVAGTIAVDPRWVRA
jgi:hypothetical protein